MQSTPETPSLTPEPWFARHPIVTTGAVAASALLVFGFVSFAMAELPPLLVDESAYRSSSGRVDAAAVQDAYNSARAPIGVTSAALLAAVAAGMGVLINARTVAVARAGLERSYLSEEASERRWREERLDSRFQEASKQLGDTSAAVRIAGVHAMVRLADEWAEHRASCVEVLCAYARMPFDHTNLAEREIRRTITHQIFEHFRTDAAVPWIDLIRFDLSGAVIEGLYIRKELRLPLIDLSKATFFGVNMLEDVRLMGSLVLSGSQFKGPFRVRALVEDTEPAVYMDRVVLDTDGEVQIALNQPEGVHSARSDQTCVFMRSLRLEGGSLGIGLTGYFGESTVAGQVSLASGSLKIALNEGDIASGGIKIDLSGESSSAEVLIGANVEHAVLGAGIHRVAVIADDGVPGVLFAPQTE